jgi:hypothetical protein
MLGAKGAAFNPRYMGGTVRGGPLGWKVALEHESPYSEFFLFFIFFLPQFCKNIRAGKNLQNYTSNAVSHDGKGPVCFQIFYLFNLNSDGGKLYMKIVAFDEINFVVQSFSISSHLHSQIMDKPSRSSSRFPTALDV